MTFAIEKGIKMLQQRTELAWPYSPGKRCSVPLQKAERLGHALQVALHKIS